MAFVFLCFASILISSSSSPSTATTAAAAPAATTATQIPLFPRSYGGYEVALPIGTPPQFISVLVDTGSSLTWVPCTSHYNCTACPANAIKSPNFKPNLSSSTRNISCTNHFCRSISGLDPHNCTGPCWYQLQYGLGTTTGKLISETLHLCPQKKKITDFVIGCSTSATQQPRRTGIAGFGRARYSIPAQLKLSKFSYCMVSHKFDDTNKSSQLVLHSGSGGGAGCVGGVSYTPFHKNPAGYDYSQFYYVEVERVTVGGKDVKIPHKYLRPDAKGNGGTIVDSGTTYTSMVRAVYGPVMAQIKAQLTQLGVREFFPLPELDVCFNTLAHEKVHVPEVGLHFKGGAHEKVHVPELGLHFKGGAHMGVPVTRSFRVLEVEVVCISITRDDSAGSAVTLGNYQQQNFYIEFDLENHRFGFKKQICGSDL